jgi:hypothetical protein
MDLYPWSFDSIHSHCHDDMIIFLKEFLIIWAITHLRDAFKKCHNERDLAVTDSSESIHPRRMRRKKKGSMQKQAAYIVVSKNLVGP